MYKVINCLLSLALVFIVGCKTPKPSQNIETSDKKPVNVQTSGAIVDIDAGEDVAVGQNVIELKQGLLLGRIARGGRSPVHTDPIEAAIIDGTFTAPKEGDFITVGEREISWAAISVDEQGWFSGRGVGGGYIYVPVVADKEAVKLMHIKGGSFVYVNGEIHMGNPYTYKDARESWEPNFNFVVVPVKLNKGINHFLINGGRGKVKVQLFDPKADAQFNLADATLPDMGQHLVSATKSIEKTVGGVIVVNSTDKPMTDLTIKAVWPNGFEEVSVLPVIAPMTSRKVPVNLTYQISKADSIDVNISLLQGGSAIDQNLIKLSVKKPGENYKSTFISQIDGSVQYYAVNPKAVTSDQQSTDALVLSVHGASVEATGQAASYSHKTWANLVAATNRRPYGFDWEDWGRMDALEVLEIAKHKFQPDPSRIYLTGHSMGGHGTWILGAQYPDKFAAIGPSAGWANFWTYRGAQTPKDATDMENMLMRAENPSHAELWFENLAQKGVYVIHGDADDNVPIEQSYFMVDYLKKFNQDYVFHIAKGMGHWWDISKEPGADCVDWAPMFDFFNRHRLPVSNEVKNITFTTSNPGVSATYNWATIVQQIEPLRFSKINIDAEPGQQRFVGHTANVRMLSLELAELGFTESLSVILDGIEVKDIKYPANGQLWLEHIGDKWQVCSKPSFEDKGPHRNGPFKEGFNHNMAFVYGTGGSSQENEAIYNKARFDAEKFWYQGNGSVDVIADTEFDLSDKDRGIILYGNSTTNKIWDKLLVDCPVRVSAGVVRIGDRLIKGDDLACLFVRPRKGSDKACVVAIAGTGIKGIKLTERLSYLYAGCNYPDVFVCSTKMLTEDADGVLAAGFFGNDWSVENGKFTFKTDATEKLKVSDGPDPRGFYMPRHYVAHKVSAPINIDGKIDEYQWSLVPWSTPHEDIEGDMRPDNKPWYQTRVKMLWDDEYLYIAAMLEEEHVWGKITERNAVMYYENDFEVFLDPDGDSHNYYEFEMNALNTVWNLMLTKPYKNSGQWSVREMPGQKTAVFVKGTLNDPSDIDQYWTVELAFPWSGMKEHAGTASCPPTDGDQWRGGFSRVQWKHRIEEGKYFRVPDRSEGAAWGKHENWVWSPQGVVSMHRPETWGYIQFSDKTPGTKVDFVPDSTIMARYLLSTLNYKQEQYKAINGQYADTVAKLDGLFEDESLASPIVIDPVVTDGKVTDYTATATVKLEQGKTQKVHIRADAKIWQD
ncbi:MAG: prolyl oligopeptidase family serine peptidase [Phycisphaerae bacterium]|nr:prolyl oligopeptidase family serine peptidase [Phycisphaerae bacterium]